MLELENSPYFALIRGESVRMSNIEKYAPYATGFVDLSFREGKLFGQTEMFTGDMILHYLPHLAGQSVKALPG